MWRGMDVLYIHREKFVRLEMRDIMSERVRGELNA